MALRPDLHQQAGQLVGELLELQWELQGLAEKVSVEQNTEYYWTRLERWDIRTISFLRQRGLNREADQLSDMGREMGMHYSPMAAVTATQKQRIDFLHLLVEDIESHPDELQTAIGTPNDKPEPVQIMTHTIFLGHGRNHLWRSVHMHLQENGLAVEAWESESRKGKHNIEVLKAVLAKCTFAVIVVTGEDATTEGTSRARQNVIHEIGLFQGRIGFERVALLEQSGIESLSNLDGLQVIRFSGEAIEHCFYELDRMLRREGVLR